MADEQGAYGLGPYGGFKRALNINDALMQTWPAQLAKSAYNAFMLPGDVYAGKVDPRSDEGIGRATDLAGALTLGAGALPAAAGNELRMGIKAYHGSPHDFDKFDMSKIGTGEGAQSYGHGLYFAENEGVAKGYRDKLSVGRQASANDRLNALQIGGKPVSARFDIDPSYADQFVDTLQNGGQKALRAEFIHHRARWAELASDASYPYRDYAAGKVKAYDGVVAEMDGGAQVQLPGRTYEVSINAHPDEFLDWDKPLSEQPESVRTALAKWTGDSKVNFYAGDNPVGSTLQNALRTVTRNVSIGTPNEVDAAVSEALRAAGIKGIRYKDAGSRAPLAQIQADYDRLVQRGAPEAERQAAWLELEKAKTKGGTHNYVVFDDKIVDILKKYGIAGLTAGGLGGAAMNGSQQPQTGLYGL